jgi:hypothetical protein
LENLTKVILVAYPDRFRLEEAKSSVESLPNEIVKVFTQKYLDRAEFEWVPVRQSNKELCEGISC